VLNDMKNILSAAAVPTLPNALPAQAGNQSAAERTEEIVVTATAVAKLDVPLAGTPQNITVITRETLECQNATSVEEILRYVPAAHAEISGRSGFDARHRKAEIELSGQIGEALIVQEGYTHLDAKARASNNGDVGHTSLKVKNAFDETYITGGDFRAVFFGERRQVQLTLFAAL